MTDNKRPWYKTWWGILGIIIGVWIALNALGSQKTSFNSAQSLTPSNNSAETKKTLTSIETPTVLTPEKSSNDSKTNYYINTQGNRVQSPTNYDSVPSGSSAKCGDGTYSFSQSRRGTCSHHGGVAQWY